jgi:hypothetical protein
MRETFIEWVWYRVNGDGTATAWPDTEEVEQRINAGESGWYCSIEGAILHGGVIATAFKRKTETVYDTAHFIRTGELLPVGERTTTTITAEPPQRIVS